MKRVLDVLLVAENAMLNARLAAAKADEANGDRFSGNGRKVFPCNQAVVRATEPGLDAIRSFRADVETEGAKRLREAQQELARMRAKKMKGTKQ